LYVIILPNTPLITLLDYDLKNTVESFSLSTVFPEWAKYLLLFLFLPHLLFAIGVFFPGAHIWSIGVEEQFYLGWPLLFRNRKINLKKAILAVIIIYCVLFYGLIIASLVFKMDLKGLNFMGVAIKFLYLQRISCMAIGGLVAIAFYNKDNNSWIKSKWVFYGSSLILLGLVAKGIRLPLLHAEVYALLFAIIFMHLSDWPHGKIRLLDNKIMNYLGNISYGIYMYNPLAVVLVVYFMLQPYTPSPYGMLQSAIYTIVCLILTLVISTLSYELMEKRLLKLKDRFS
jgi:peptidoglycan/LPS O-acetylase OafA/YrhL